MSTFQKQLAFALIALAAIFLFAYIPYGDPYRAVVQASAALLAYGILRDLKA